MLRNYVAAFFVVILSPLMLIEWLWQLHRRAKDRRQQEAHQFGESIEDDL